MQYRLEPSRPESNAQERRVPPKATCRPPALRRSHASGVESARDLGEALTGVVLGADARDDLGRET
jgi:hypothetical protein